MRKIVYPVSFFLTFLLLTAISLVLPINIRAQGTFTCVWGAIGQTCLAGSGGNHCDPTYWPDDNVCIPYNGANGGNQATCESHGAQCTRKTCIGADTHRAGYCYNIFNNQVECPSPPNIQEDDSPSSCPSTAIYRCCLPPPAATDCLLTVIQPAIVNQTTGAGITLGNPNTLYALGVFGTSGSCVITPAPPLTTDASGTRSFTLVCNAAGTYGITAGSSAAANPRNCTTTFQVVTTAPTPPGGGGGGGGGTPPNPLGQPPCGPQELYTAIGCIPILDQNTFISFLLRWAIGIAGGIAILLIIYAAFLVITSGGNPQQLQAGKELLTAAVMGLVLILFGTFILNLIGVEILNIPGFG